MKKMKSNKPRVGIIDDNRHDREIIGGWFAEEGCRVSSAKDSLEAESILSDIDIVLVDFDLGCERGLDLAKKIRSEHPEILVYLMTSKLKSTFSFRGFFGEIQCIEKTFRAELFVPVIMNFWELEHSKGPDTKERKIKELLLYKDRITGLNRNNKNPKRESLTGRLNDPEGRDIRWVVYDGYQGHGDTIDICLAVLFGCFGRCRQCFSGLFRINARRLMVVEMISEFLHSLDSVHARNYLNRKISVSFSNEGDFIFNWKKVFRFMTLLSQVKELDISFVISTIGNVKVFRQFIKAYSKLPIRLPVRIYLSLHSLFRGKREWLLPATKGQSIEETREVLAEFSRISGQKVTLQWLLIRGFNDSADDIKMIVNTFKGLWEQFDVKVMPFSEKGKKNYLADYGFTIPATMEDAHAFAYELSKRGVPARAREDCGIYDEYESDSMGNTVPNFDGFKPTT